MANDDTVGIGVDLDTGNLGREAADAAAVFTKMLAAIEGMAKGLSESVKISKQLGDNFTQNAKNFKQLTDEQKAFLKDQLDSLKAQSGGTAVARDRILGGASPNGGTLRDDQLKQFGAKAMITSLGSSDAQLEAQLKEAAGKLAQRMIRTTEEAMRASFNRAAESVSTQNLNFGNATALHANRVATEYTRIKRDEANSPFATGADRLVDERQTAFMRRARQEADRENLEFERAAKRKAIAQWVAANEENQRFEAVAKNRAVNMRAEADTRNAKIDADARARARYDYANAVQQNKAMDAANKPGRGFGERIGARAQLATDYIAIGAIYGGATAAVKSIVDLDDALGKFAAITQTSRVEMVGFEASLLKMGETSRFTVKDLADVATTLGQTGLSASEVIKTLPAVTTLATAAGTSLRESVDLIASVMGAYNLQASQAGDIANTVAAALNGTKLTTTQLAQALSYSSNIAKEAGVSFSELTAVLGGLAQAGIRSGSTIGTGTRKLIQDLAAPSTKLLEVMKPLGITLNDIDIKANGLVGALENLRAKGFTTADALKSLDLRAAAAYAALASQTEKLKILEQSFLLSNAANEGAARASETLSAGLTRLGNTIFSVLDQAFKPMVELLKIAVDGFSNLFGAISNLGPILGVGTTLLASYGLALASIKFIGVASQIPIFIAGLGQITTALVGTTGAMTALGAASSVAFGPVGIAVATVGIAVAAGLALWANSASDTANALDKLRAKGNELQSTQQKTETSISSINATIDGLLERRAQLDKDPLGSQTEIIKAQKAFSDLGLTVKTGSTSIDELVTALQKLRAELSTELPDTLEKRLALADKTIQLSLKEGKEKDQANQKRIDPRRARNFSNQKLDGGLNPTLDFLATPFDQVDPAEAMNITGPLRRGIDEMRGKYAGNSELIKVLDEFDNMLKERVQLLNGIQSQKLQKLADETTRGSARISALPEATDLRALRDSLLGELKSGMQEINANPLSSPGQKRDGLTTLSDTLSKKVGDISARFTNFEDWLKEGGFSEAEIDGALKELKDQLKGFENGVIVNEKQAAEAWGKLNKLVFDAKKRANAAEMTEARTKLKNAQNPTDVAYGFRRIQDLIDLEHEIEVQLITNGIKDPAKLTDEQKQRLLDEQARTDAATRKNAQEEAERNRQDAITGLGVQSAALGGSKAMLDAQIAELKKLIANPSTTVEKAKEIEKQINKLLDQVAEIVKRQIQVDTDRSLMQNGDMQGTGGARSLAPNADGVARQIADVLTSMNKSGLLTTALAFAQQESRFDTDANRNNSKKAKGLFQFMPDTFDANGGGDLYKLQDQVRNFVTYIGKIDAVLAKTLGRAPTEFERYVGWQQGEGGGSKLLGADPNAPANRFVTDAAISGNRGDPNGTVGAFLAVIRAQFEAAQKATAGLTVSQKDLIEAQGEAKKVEEEAKIRTQREEAEKSYEAVKYRKDAVDAGKAQVGDEKTIAARTAAIGTTDSSAAAEKLVLEIVGLLAGELERKLKLLDSDPQYKGDPERKKAAQDALRAEYGGRFDKLSVANAKNAADQDTTVLKKKLESLQADRDANIEMGKGTVELDKQIYALTKRLSLSQPLVEKERELAILTAEINAAKENGLGDDKSLEESIERQAVLQREILALKQKQSAVTKAMATDPTFGQAFEKGSVDFFKNAGMLNADGNFKSFTQEMSGYWTEALGGMSSSMSTLFKNLASGTMKAGQAFKEFAKSIIGNMLDIASKAVSNEILKMLFGGASQGGGGLLASLFGGGGGFAGDPSSAIGGLMYHGGVVRAATGATPTRDSKLIMMQPGEGIVRKSAMEMLGSQGLDEVNFMANRTLSKSQMGSAIPRPRVPDNVNVWVASPDQIPPPGPKDIIHVISSDIQNRGNIRQLIRQVQLGQT